MDKIQGYLSAASGRSIGKSRGEFVFLYPSSGVLHVDEIGVRPYMTSLQSMANYQFHPFSKEDMEEFEKLNAPEIKAEATEEEKPKAKGRPKK